MTELESTPNLVGIAGEWSLRGMGQNAQRNFTYPPAQQHHHHQTPSTHHHQQQHHQAALPMHHPHQQHQQASPQQSHSHYQAARPYLPPPLGNPNNNVSSSNGLLSSNVSSV